MSTSIIRRLNVASKIIVATGNLWLKTERRELWRDGAAVSPTADHFLTEQQAAVATGSTFGVIAGKYVRVSMAADDYVVGEGLEGVCAFIKKKS